jgi:hypothetical protein
MSARRLRPARRGRRIGGDGKTVPTPQIAVLRDQSLAGLEFVGYARLLAPGGDADLGVPSRPELW